MKNRIYCSLYKEVEELVSFLVKENYTLENNKPVCVFSSNGIVYQLNDDKSILIDFDNIESDDYQSYWNIKDTISFKDFKREYIEPMYNIEDALRKNEYIPKGDLEGFPNEIILAMLDEQEKQGNPRNISIFEVKKNANKKQKGFNWNKCKVTECFWESIIKYRLFILFSIDTYKPDIKAIQCKTEDFAIKTINQLKQLGGCISNSINTNWSKYGIYTCYYINKNGIISCNNLNWVKQSYYDFILIQAEEFLMTNELNGVEKRNVNISLVDAKGIYKIASKEMKIILESTFPELKKSPYPIMAFSRVVKCE